MTLMDLRLFFLPLVFTRAADSDLKYLLLSLLCSYPLNTRLFSPFMSRVADLIARMIGPMTAAIFAAAVVLAWFAVVGGRVHFGLMAKADRPPFKKIEAAATAATPSSASGAVRARRPCQCQSKGRNLVVCIDGTANQFSKKNTNVVELYSRLVKGSKDQITFYNSGIGTYATPSWRSWSYYQQVVGHKIDLAIAWRFERILLSAYLWLSENYQEGDRIFLFGFSRGAYQVRALSAMIAAVGLIHKGNQDQIPFAYQLYAETKSADENMKERFKTTFSWKGVQVHFVGAWDTVSSVGIIRDKNLPGTTDGMKHVCYFRHALALHERRVKFLPEYVRGGLGPEIDPTEDPKALHTKEVWFTGSHSDIGGGASENDTLDKFGPALRWMSFEATQFGLLLEDAPRKWAASKISDSLTKAWKPFEYIPLSHLSYKGQEDTMSWPHLGNMRVIQAGQRLHQSVLEAVKQDDELLRGRALDHYAIELDPYGAVGSIYHEMGTTAGQPLAHHEIEALSLLTDTEQGLQSLRDLALELTPTDSMSIAMRLLSSFSSLYLSRSSLPRNTLSATDAAYTVATVLETFKHQYPFARVRPIARAIARKDTKRADEVIKRIAVPLLRSLRSLRGHERGVLSVAFLPDGRHLVSSSRDRTLRIWDIETGETVIGPVEGHSDGVPCVAVHGSRIASCSYDGTFRVWNADTGALVLGPITAHDGKDLNWIAYSRDGTRIATAGDNHSAIVWDASTGVQLREMFGHRAPVTCIAFSEDGKRLVSGSGDKTIGIWDVASGRCIGEPLTGHASWVNTVCFSPDDKRVLSSSNDNTICIWDAETRALIFEPLQLDNWVLSMALSSDGKHLASGSRSGKIAMWYAENGASIPTSFKDHEDWVRSVVFSPDGRLLATASDDKTIALWEAADDWNDINVEDVEKDND